jgi:multidrug efflux pump subunit AcrB
MKSVFRFFAERHKLATLLMIMVLLLGISTLMGIKRDIYPEVDFGVMHIMTLYPGASPEDVELNVTNKIEEELKTVTGIDNFVSYSMENVSLVMVTLDIDVEDQDKVKTDIREAVSRVTEFPEEVTESPLVTEMGSSDFEIIEVGLTGDVPYRELRDQARLFEKKLNNVPGVSRLKKFGYRDREIKVEVSPDKIADLQIPMRDVIRAIQARNIHGTAGTFESYTSEKDLVTLAQFEEPADVGDVIVRSSFDGPIVKVKDLAAIKDDFEDERLSSRMNGIPAISFLVFLKKNADAIRTIDDIKELIDRENANLGEIEIIYTNDTSRVVRNSFNVVLQNGLMGLILVVLLLPVFLNVRTAFWVAMGIPVTMLGAIYLLPIFDSYLDTITLTGLVLVIGIVVDDAIIVAENVFTHRERGASPVDAAVNGISEVFPPVVTTVLTTFLVFAPMFFMPGIFGKFVFVIPLAISLALFISLAEVSIALPAHLARGLHKSRKSSLRTWFNPIRSLFRRTLIHLLKLRYAIVLFSGLLLAGSLWYAGEHIKFILFPSEAAQEFFIMIEMPTGTPLATTSSKIREIEEIVAQLPEEELASFNTRIGVQVMLNAESEAYGAMAVFLTPYADRSRSADQIVEEVRARTDSLAGFKSIAYSINTGGPPVGKPINIRVVGSDDAVRTELADSVEAFLGTIEGVKDITRDDKGGKDQVVIDVDYDKLSRLGLTVQDVAQNVRIAYDGQVVTSVRYGEEDVDFRVMMSEKERQRQEYLKRLQIPNNRGRLIPLSEVATLKSGPGHSDYRHYDGERAITIEADLMQDIVVPAEVTRAVFAHFDLDRDWPGMQLGLGGEVVETAESMAGLYRTMVIALIGIYFLLVLLFNSFSQPLLVMIAIPFGIMGVIFAFGIHSEPFSFVAIMGVVGLSGVVVNDSLVLVNHLNRLREKGGYDSIRELVSHGAADRLRPIVMTTLSTVVALLPLAYGLGGTALFMAPMALALGWGLIFATPLTLVLLPCLYVIAEDIRRLLRLRPKENRATPDGEA